MDFDQSPIWIQKKRWFGWFKQSMWCFTQITGHRWRASTSKNRGCDLIVKQFHYFVTRTFDLRVALFTIQIVRQLWVYIRKHNLQDPANKRTIICDEALRSVFETDSTDMFKMNKLLSKHILPLDPSM